MCGIGLVFFKNNINPVKLSLIARNELTNRGPNWTVENFSDSIFLHQSVLSIQTDPSNSEKSLKRIRYSEQNKFTLYNGEIYSQDFLENKNDFDFINQINKIDELENFLKKVDGMFSLIKVDMVHDQIQIDAFRDVIGEKRLYFYLDKKSKLFIIASTASFIFKVLKSYNFSPKIDYSSILDYFQKRHFINNFSAIKDIKQLESGFKLSFNTEIFDIKLKKYDSLLRFFDAQLYKSISSLPNHEYISLVKNTIQKELISMNSINNLQVSQNNVFSGGIDSSLVTALSYENDLINIQNIYTLTFGNKDPVSKAAHSLLKNWGLPNIIHDVNVEEYLYALCRCIELQSAPVSTHSLPSSYVLAQLCRKYSDNNKSSVLMGGEGADELFLGYSYYLEGINKKSIVPSLYSDDIRGFKSILERSDNDLYEEKFVEDFFLSQMEEDIYAATRRNAFCDYKYQLPNVGLAAADIISSDLGIEFRTPFTRHELVKLIFNSPTSKLLNPKKKISKFPLDELYRIKFNKKPLSKIGFAGFPNELLNVLDLEQKTSQIKKFLKNEFKSYEESRDTSWKEINIAIFCDIHDFNI